MALTARFRNEAAALGKLRHESIVVIHDYDAAGDLAWIVMDWIDGVPLHQWKKEKQRSVNEVAAMMAKVAAAAGAAHAEGVTHRDLKPANVLVHAGGEEPVLIDFGLAMLADAVGRTRLTRSSILAGTVEYIAPEQVDRTLGDLGPATDVHGCGLILWELLSGKPLRQGEPAEILSLLQKQDGPPALPREVPENLAAICLKALAYRPGDRYLDGAALASDLNRHLEGRIVLARMPGPAERLWRQLQRRPARVAALAAAVAVALAVVSYQNSDREQRLSNLVSEINQGLMTPPRSHAQFDFLQGQLNKLEALSPIQAQAMRGNLAKIVGAQLQKELGSAMMLTDSRLEEIGRIIQRLRSLDSRAATQLETWRKERQTNWQELGLVSAPYGKEERVNLFGEIKVREVPNPMMGGQPALLLPLRELIEAPSHRLAPLIQPGQHVEVELTWSFDPKRRSLMGIHLDNDEVAGAELKICQFKDLFDNIPPDAPDGEPSDWILVHSREGKIRDMRRLSAAEAEAPLTKLTYRIEGALMTMEVNGTPFAQEVDWFRWSGFRTPGYAKVLHAGSALLVSARMRVRPGQTGSLGEADSMYHRGEIDRAALTYHAHQNEGERVEEACYKEAICLRELGHDSESETLFKKVARSTAAPWRGMAALELWQAELAMGNLRQAAPWAKVVMEAQRSDAELAFVIPRPLCYDIRNEYQHILRGLALLDRSSEHEQRLHEATQAMMALRSNSLQVAAEVAGALHMAGRNEEAMGQLHGALTAMNPLRLASSERRLAAECVDLLMMISPRHRDYRTTQLLSVWVHADFQRGEPGWAVYELDDIRAQYERGLYERVAMSAEKVSAMEKASLVLRTEAALMSGLALQRAGKSEDALQMFRKMSDLDGEHGGNDSDNLRLVMWGALGQILGQSWSPSAAREWLQTLVLASMPLGRLPPDLSPILLNDAAETVREAAVNAALDGGFQEIVSNMIFRRTAPRLLLESMVKRLCLHWFLDDSLSLPATSGQMRTLDKTIELFWSEMTSARLTPEVLLKLLAEWNGFGRHLSWDKDTADWTPELRGRMAWLFSWRFHSLNQPLRSAEYKRFLQESGGLAGEWEVGGEE